MMGRDVHCVPRPLILVVCGSRSLRVTSKNKDAVRQLIHRSMEAHYGDCEIVELVSGNARGADRLCENWAKLKGIPIRRFLPDYQLHEPKLAPIIRNGYMADYGDELIAFWDGASFGTKDMIEKMKRRSKPVTIIYTKSVN